MPFSLIVDAPLFQCLAIRHCPCFRQVNLLVFMSSQGQCFWIKTKNTNIWVYGEFFTDDIEIVSVILFQKTFMCLHSKMQ